MQLKALISSQLTSIVNNNNPKTMRLSTTKPVRASISPHGHTITNFPTNKNNLNLKVDEAPRTSEHLSNGAKLNANSSSYWLEPQTNYPTMLNKRWMDYQGFKNWEGLLDPLDDNLRSEIIRYGYFVESAYRSCEFDLSSSSYATCRYPKRKLLNESGLQGTGYQVTKNLIATSGIELPGWADGGPTWMTTRSSWIGYVAICKDKRETTRLGRRDVVITFRGTTTGLEWLENLRATLTPLPDFGSGSGSGSEPMVQSGFLSLYTSSLKNKPSLQTLVRQEISRILKKYGDEPLSFTITGHSLGAALATLAAYDIKKCFRKSPMVTVISFAGPRVGNRSFRGCLEKQGTKILRIVNSDDLITKVPGFVEDDNENDGFSKNCGGNAAAGLGGWVQKLVGNTQWVYADVGCELRLSSRDSPYLNGINMATCHDLKTYLHLVDGFVSPNCPFRATARKMMNKIN